MQNLYHKEQHTYGSIKSRTSFEELANRWSTHGKRWNWGWKIILSWPIVKNPCTLKSFYKALMENSQEWSNLHGLQRKRGWYITDLFQVWAQHYYAAIWSSKALDFWNKNQQACDKNSWILSLRSFLHLRLRRDYIWYIGNRKVSWVHRKTLPTLQMTEVSNMLFS